MKALFNRFKDRGHHNKDKDRYSTVDSPGPSTKEKLPELPPLTDWPPHTVASTPNSSLTPLKPLPDLSLRPLPPIDPPPPIVSSNSQSSTVSSKTQEPPLAPITPVEDERIGLGLTTVTRTASPRHDPDSSGRSSRKTTNGTVASHSDPHSQKKVAFISPPPTPAPMERVLSDIASTNGDSLRSTTVPLKTNLSRFQAAHPGESRGSTSSSSSSKVNIVPKQGNGSTTKATSTRTVLSPNSQRGYGDNASLNPSMRSGTPYSQASQSTSRILATASWSEAAEEDLVSNIGPRERTRQEVLWEIVASEERYVAELLKLKETFIEPLLHPYSTSPVSSPTLAEHEDRTESYHYRVDSPQESIDHLPIAARFLSPLGFRSDTPSTAIHPPSTKDGTPNIDGESLETEEDEAQDLVGKSYAEKGPTSQRKQGSSAVVAAAAKFNHPRSPYNTTAERSASKNEKPTVPFPSRSHQSLPPPPRGHALAASTPTLGRQSFIGLPAEQNNYNSSADAADRKAGSTPASRVLRKWKRSTTTQDIIVNGAVAPHQLPEDLRKCLEVLEGGIFNGHVILSEGLRKRYEDQYPLVRSLADVFVSNSHILHEYATYVLHLERALEQVDDALSTANDMKKPKKQDAAEWMKVSKFLQKLEEHAAEKGETGLAISLSKPFQRLLKYPLLFQNLLYHTDPSTYEYESTLQMVAEVETIVRSIEDEKIQKEERDKTRDAFARIEGLEKVKQLALPKPSRLLVEERVVPGANAASMLAPPAAANGKNVKGKTSFRRLSDVLQPMGSSGVGGKKDLWFVVFNDVVLRCQRTGVTSLPLASTTNSRTNSLPELQAKAKYATTGRRSTHTKPRNLYKFIKIETWAIGGVVQPREGVVSMEDVVRSRAQVHSGIGQNVSLPEDMEEDGVESDDSDRKSKMSFSYWGADKVTIHKPAVKGRAGTPSGLRKGAITPSSYARESSANAKFGTRLITHDGPRADRPASRRTQATPTSRRTNQSEDNHSTARSTVTTTRPAWDGSTRAVPATTTTTPAPTKRVRNLSQNESQDGAGVAPRASSKSLASPAPSEDSGVGLYRQFMAQDSSLGRE